MVLKLTSQHPDCLRMRLNVKSGLLSTYLFIIFAFLSLRTYLKFWFAYLCVLFGWNWYWRIFFWKRLSRTGKLCLNNFFQCWIAKMVPPCYTSENTNDRNKHQYEFGHRKFALGTWQIAEVCAFVSYQINQTKSFSSFIAHSVLEPPRIVPLITAHAVGGQRGILLGDFIVTFACGSAFSYLLSLRCSDAIKRYAGWPYWPSETTAGPCASFRESCHY